MTKKRVAITGMGLVTPAGIGWRAYWDAVLSGKSSLSDISYLSSNGFPSKLAGTIPDFQPKEYIKQRKQLKLMSREIQLAVAASQLALQDADFTPEQSKAFRYGVSLGTGVINTELDEIGVGIRNGVDESGKFNLEKFGQDGVRSLFPLWLLKYLPNMPACHVSITHGLKGPSNTLTTSSAAGTQAIGEAMRVIQRGDADMMIAGGTDSKINAMGLARFNLLGFLSDSHHRSGDVYCPFDEKHSGMILGEGAGLFVLESWEHATKRGARIYGELLGYGSSSDYNYDPRTTEDCTGKCLAIKRAIEDADIDTQDVDFLMANGSGIPQEDEQEAVAIRNVFKPSLERIRVTGVKPITGHMVYASGSTELAAGVMALKEGVIPHIANLSKPATYCDLPFVQNESESSNAKVFVLNSFGFGGQNACLAVKK